MNLIRKVKSQAEKDELLKQAKREWDAIDPAISRLVAESEDHYLAAIAATIEVENIPFTPARELTAEELARQDGALMFSQIYGDRADNNVPDVFKKMVAEQEAVAFQKLIAPGQRAKNTFEAMVEEAIEALTKRSNIRRESDREPLVIRKGSASTYFAKSGGRIEYDENENESTEYGVDGRFLRCWVGSPSDRPNFESLSIA
jgi:hypothetical protein